MVEYQVRKTNGREYGTAQQETKEIVSNQQTSIVDFFGECTISDGEDATIVVEVIDDKSVYDVGDVETAPVEVVNDGGFGSVIAREDVESVDVEDGDTWNDGGDCKACCRKADPVVVDDG